MAFLPEIASFEEQIISAYDLSTGGNVFTSSDIAQFKSFSLHFNCTDVSGNNTFFIEQSNDNTNWSNVSPEDTLPIGNSNFIIDKQFFSGKYLRIEFITNETGTVDCVLIAKR